MNIDAINLICLSIILMYLLVGFWPGNRRYYVSEVSVVIVDL